MSSSGLASILYVDDEPNALEGVARLLRGRFAVTVADSGAAALDLLQAAGPFAVIMSDLRMPGMDGIRLLERARELAPYTVRVLLTGYADLEAAIAAVNDGHVFRFLTKPCPPDVLLQGLQAAVEQYRLITAEPVLLEQTLHGSIKTLTDLLALLQPALFGRATRAKRHVSALADELNIQDRWYIEVAAMLSQIGAVTLPAETASKVYHGLPLTDEERQKVERLPARAEALLASIPRLEPVREIIRYQAKHYDGKGVPRDDVSGTRIPLGARMLKIVLDFDVLQAQGRTATQALDLMKVRAGHYDRELLEAFSTVCERQSAGESEVLELPLRMVQRGMVFVEDVRTWSGLLLIARGQEMTENLLERVRNLSPYVRVVEPVRVRRAATAEAKQSAEAGSIRP